MKLITVGICLLHLTSAAYAQDAPDPTEHKAIATMPANLLQLLPALEDGVEFRFIGRHLILRDTKANIIIDDIPFALTCSDCKRWNVEPRDEDRRR